MCSLGGAGGKSTYPKWTPEGGKWKENSKTSPMGHERSECYKGALKL